MRFSFFVYKTYHRILLERLIAKYAHNISGSMLDIGALNPRYNHLFKASVTSVDIIVNEKLGVKYGDIEKGLEFEDAEGEPLSLHNELPEDFNEILARFRDG